MKLILWLSVLLLIIVLSVNIIHRGHRASQALAFKRFLPNELMRRANNPLHIPDDSEIKEVILIGRANYGPCSAVLYVCDDEKYGFCTYMESNPRIEKEFAIGREGALPDLAKWELDRIKQHAAK